ncbi:MAG: fumarate hydratase [Candidatus Cloacimonadales bacterium]|jgi:fumarate hydratase subunit alpha|nr:fumarate hydratase [Candidatus Cloacimonadota bacterium]MCB5256634.1 fumarate hydratase [Candidatus Cloacimonadota bacterium]MCB5263525.1 fumarate hydratase [Candidatus Cloacimonadota bacterium]MCB5277133.1 fumarate hydratase [Candidatus Cloacimonadota bacterium]MCK9435286.1 fumarate hydratase [Candidatus Cloacimonadota bacterium]
MRKLSKDTITRKVFEAIRYISYHPDPDMSAMLQDALNEEESDIVRDVLNAILENHRVSASDRIPLCQDTGSTVVFADLGIEVQLEEALQDSINRAVIQAQRELPLRASIMKDPYALRQNSGNNSPGIVHINSVSGSGLNMWICQKGGGAENMSFLKMFNPGADHEEIVNYISEKVIAAGSKPCPPLILGIGIGGNFETAPLLAKRALLEALGREHPKNEYALLERDIKDRVNAGGCGVQGFGGNHTVLAVHVLSAPCHIASLPIAVNVECHAHRHIRVEV